jgi:exonuclease SbcC
VKILRLTLAGFGPFKDEQVVDFEAFDDAGLFLITGRTGAGKSSILDAICYALYDSVPRYESSQHKLRSDYCEPTDPTFVELEFSVGTERYRVRRTPSYEKPKLRGEGFTTAAATAQLARRVGGDWEGMSARAGDVGRDLDEIVGLSKNQFLQVILLAQNRFQQFLRANNDERQAVLRTLFSSQRFEQIEKALDERRKALEGDLVESDRALAEHAARAARLLARDSADTDSTETDATARTSAAWFDESLAALVVLHREAETAAATADLAFAAADMEHRAVLDTVTLQKRRITAAETIAALDARDPVITAARAELDAARRAAPVWPLITAAAAASAALDAARAVEAAARADWAPFTLGDDDSGRAERALAARIDELSSALGALAEVLDDERRLPGIEARILTLSADIAAVEETLSATAERAEALPAQIDALAALLTDASVRAARAPDATETVARLTAAKRAAGAVVRAETTLELAAAAEKSASSANIAAALSLDVLLESRLTGHAAELAAVLVDGHPCAVCGSVSHPSPARGTAEPVTAGDITAARAVLADCSAAMDAAHGRVLAATGELADARARALGRSLAELDDELQTAREQLRSAEDAADELSSLNTQRESLRTEQKAVGERLATLRTRREETATALGEQIGLRESIGTRVDAQRGDSATVTERAERLSAELLAVRALHDARVGTAGRLEAHDLASGALARQLAEESFADADEARNARRTATEVAALETTVRRHDESRATAAATLDEPGVSLVSDEPIDVEPSRLALAEALAHRDDTRDTARDLSERASRLQSIVAEAARDRQSTETKRAEFDQLRQLAGVVRGDEPNTKRMRLETYVLAAQLEEIVAAANGRLGTMTGGRYALEHDDGLQYRNTKSGLGLAIRDEYTGRSRATNSLSGGETFLASLALALGLAEVVTNQAGGITLDTLLIDEGFGSLDAETLDIAMSTLDGLRSGGRTIGLISHVEAMKEQITAKLRITVTPHGASEIEETLDLD